MITISIPSLIAIFISGVSIGISIVTLDLYQKRK